MSPPSIWPTMPCFAGCSAAPLDACPTRCGTGCWPRQKSLGRLSNLSLNLLVTLRYENEGDSLLARVKVPAGGGTSRFVRVGSSRTFVDLADVMANNLDLLFPGMEVEACALFRVTRNAVTERDEEEAEDLLEMIESELRERK